MKGWAVARLLMVAGAWAVAGASAVGAQEPDHAHADDRVDEHMLEEVVVVGTRRRERSPGALQVPVDILDGEDLQADGNGDTLDILTSRIPSYNVGREPISDAATLIRPANLRGLPADSTLVLVNGKRRHRGAVIGEFVAGINKGAQAVDIVPLAGIALKRVEVLRDGASAQYGSDAIAGVLNFVLEDDPNVRRLRLQYGSTYEGDGDQIPTSGIAATRRLPSSCRTARRPAGVRRTRRPRISSRTATRGSPTRWWSGARPMSRTTSRCS